MAVGKEIVTKIASVKSTQKITSAMELVAASKMRKAQERMLKSRPYADKIAKVIGHLANSHSEFMHPFMQQREVKRVGYIIVTTDRGLCGGLNNNLLKQLVLDIANKQNQGIEIDLCLIGSKGLSFFKRFGGNVVAQASGMGDTPGIEDLIGVVKAMFDRYNQGEIDNLYLAFNQFENTMKQNPTIQQVLPLVSAEDESKEHYWDYIYEPDSKGLLELLLQRYIESQVYQSVVENMASEQASRMIAMKSATDNAGDIIDELQLIYNKARQAAITSEIAEIVAGAEAVE